MRLRSVLLIVAFVGASVVGAGTGARAQYCADDDYSASCRAQRQCEQTRALLERTGLRIISCTQ